MKRFVIVMLLGLCFVQYLIQPHGDRRICDERWMARAGWY